ncbi:uncharacterized protein A4U43_C06F13040 [Asparagus officinalis]|uniref:Uncharacterized protein n=1 Tax=Asparagus officinalis TaxID=4686 RepID=A0A5P1EMJ8_ASPOF|nr:uncharacterized protein A4U43_C06F13040 [Asparagus officinalis]
MEEIDQNQLEEQSTHKASLDAIRSLEVLLACKGIETKGEGIILDVGDGDEEGESGDDQSKTATAVVQLNPAPESSTTLQSPTPDPSQAP